MGYYWLSVALWNSLLDLALSLDMLVGLCLIGYRANLENNAIVHREPVQ